MAELPTHVLRYWESEFPAISPKRAKSKQRLYRRQDVELIFKIKSLLHDEGYTIAGARKLMESGSPVTPQKTISKPILSGSTKLVEIKEELIKIKQLLGKDKKA